MKKRSKSLWGSPECGRQLLAAFQVSGPLGDSVEECGLQIGWEEWAENNGKAWQCEKPLSFCAGEMSGCNINNIQYSVRSVHNKVFCNKEALFNKA